MTCFVRFVTPLPSITLRHEHTRIHIRHLSRHMYSCRQKWCPEYEAGLFKTIVEHTAAELFDAATQDRSTTDTTVRVGVDRRAKQPQR